MRLIPLVLAALLVLLTSPARGAVATGEAPPQRELSPDLLVLLLGPPRAELDAQLAAGPEGLQGPGRASKERSPLPAWVLLVLELDAQGDESWIPETRVADSAFSGGFPTGADPPLGRSPSTARAHGYDGRREDFGFQGLRRELVGDDFRRYEMYAAAFRHSRPNLGRWTSRDPGGFIDGPNRYAKNFNNPMRWTDLSGLSNFGIEWSGGTDAIRRGEFQAKPDIEGRQRLGVAVAKLAIITGASTAAAEAAVAYELGAFAVGAAGGLGGLVTSDVLEGCPSSPGTYAFTVLSAGTLNFAAGKLLERLGRAAAEGVAEGLEELPRGMQIEALLDDVANRANALGDRYNRMFDLNLSAQELGKLKHRFASRLLRDNPFGLGSEVVFRGGTRFESLRAMYRSLGGPASGQTWAILDVWDEVARAAYDFKFGAGGLSNAQTGKIFLHSPASTAGAVRPTLR